MLWRADYNTWEQGRSLLPAIIGRRLDGLPFDQTSYQVLIGGFDLRAQAELGVWWRLLSDHSPDLKFGTVYFLGLPDARLIENLAAMIPKSKWADTIVAEPSPEWTTLIKPDRPERSFAGVVREGMIDPLMIGSPTEEAWDRFLASL